MRNILLLAALFCPPLYSQQLTAVDVTGLSGTYLLTVQGDNITVVPMKLVRTGPTPPPPPPPPDVTLTPRGVAIRDAAMRASADTNRERTALELAAMYSDVSARVKAGTLKNPEMIAAVIKGATDALLTQRSVPTAWQPMRDTLSSQWAAVAQEGATEAKLAKLLDECAAGLTASVSQPQAINLQMILEIIKLIIELLERFRPPVVLQR